MVCLYTPALTASGQSVIRHFYGINFSLSVNLFAGLWYECHYSWRIYIYTSNAYYVDGSRRNQIFFLIFLWIGVILTLAHFYYMWNRCFVNLHTTCNLTLIVKESQTSFCTFSYLHFLGIFVNLYKLLPCEKQDRW